MTAPLLLPKELFNVEHRLDGGPNRDGKGFGPFEAPANLSFCLVVHTTETPGVPYYSGGVHPHLTFVPGGLWAQHLPFNRRAGTLRGSSTVENGTTVPTNRANAIQIEIAAYSDWRIAAKYNRLAVRDLPESDLRELARFIRFIFDEFGADGQPMVWFPYIQNSTGIMKHAQWIPSSGNRDFSVIDHWGAPDDSSHWDSGAINRHRIMQLVAELGGVGPSVPPPPPDPMADWPDYMRYQDRHPAVLELKALLFKAGFRVWPRYRDLFTSGVVWAVKRFQETHKDTAGVGLAVDGIVGPKTRQALRAYL